jgi:hypothetical protein
MCSHSWTKTECLMESRFIDSELKINDTGSIGDVDIKDNPTVYCCFDDVDTLTFEQL